MRHATFILVPVATLALIAGVLAGTTRGASPPAPQLTVAPTSYAFGTATVGSQTTHSFTVTFSGKGNSGKLAISIGGSASDIANFSASVTTNTCSGVSLSAKNPTCTFDGIFAPQGVGDFSAYFQVAGRSLTRSVSISGTGEAVTLPSLSISDNPLTYYNSSNNVATFTVTMSAVASSAVTFNWAATDDTAVWGTTCDGTVDYTSASNTGTGTIAAGATTTTIAFGTCINAPGYHYPWTPTYFTVTISNPTGATITDDTGAGTIRTS